MTEGAPKGKSAERPATNKFGVRYEDFERDVFASENELGLKAQKLLPGGEWKEFARFIVLKALGKFELYDPAAERQSEGGTQIMAWLYTIMKNEATERLRKEGYRRKRKERLSPDDHFMASFPDMEEAVDNAQLRAIVRKHLEALPSPRKEVLELMLFSGLEQQEIAERLGIPQGTVKSAASRGLAQIRPLVRADAGR